MVPPATNAASDSASSALWAITCYFNPMHYQRRLENYRHFRRRLAVPLVTVELSLDGRFELGAEAADVMVQVSARDVMWHKERLLNIALGAVPSGCRKVAWLDCDVVFANPDWARLTGEALDRFVLVEPFQNVCELARQAGLDEVDHPQNERRGRALAYGLTSGAVGPEVLDQNMRMLGWNSGLAWAGRREVLEKDGFYDSCIMGGGNRAMVCAALGRFDYGVRYLQMNPPWADHYLAWARAHFESVRGNIGFVEGTLIHLWHGDLKDRRYSDRHTAMKGFEFNPQSDIALDKKGCWCWSSDKPKMHQYVRDYFAARKEDG